MLAGCVNDAYKGIKQCVEQVLALR
jgi:hypothetical protein